MCIVNLARAKTYLLALLLTGGGGGGEERIFITHHQIISCHSETPSLMASKLCDLLFLPLCHIFQTRGQTKLETGKFFVLLKMAEIYIEGYNLGSEKLIWFIKSDFGIIE